MIYIYYFIGIAIIIYGLVDFKKKPNDNPFNVYHNSRYYRLVILVACAIIGAIIYLFINRK